METTEKLNMVKQGLQAHHELTFGRLSAFAANVHTETLTKVIYGDDLQGNDEARALVVSARDHVLGRRSDDIEEAITDLEAAITVLG